MNILFCYFFISIFQLSYQDNFLIKPNEKYKYIEANKVQLSTFYFEINNIPINEEGIITFYSDFNIKLNFNCIFRDYPPENNFAATERCKFNVLETEFKNYYQIPFVKKENHKYFILTVNKDNEISINQNTFKILYSIPILQPEIEYLSSKKEKINLFEYEPIYYKYKLTKNDDKGLTYLFYTDSNYMTLYHGNILDVWNKENLQYAREYIGIFKMDKYSRDYSKIVLVKFFSNITTKINYGTTNQDFESQYFINLSKRPSDITYAYQIINPFHPFYLVGIYNYDSTDLIYIEQVVGEFNAYYTNEFNFDNIFPNEYYGEKLNSKYIMAYTNRDIITVQCKSVCFFNIHFVSQKNLKAESITGKINYYAIISNEKSKNYNFYNIEEFESINFRTSSKASVKINYDDEKYDLLDEDIRTFKPQKRFFTAQTFEEEVLLIFVFNFNSLYKNLNEGNNIINKEKYYVYRIPKNDNSNIERFEFHIKNVNDNDRYHFGFGKDDSIFFPDSKIKINKSESQIIRILNPYTSKLSSSYKKELFFYVSFYFTENTEINVKVVKRDTTLNLIAPNKITRFTKETKFYIQPNENYYDKLVIVITKCGLNEIDMYIKIDGIVVKREYLGKQFNLIYFDDKFFGNYEISIEKAYENEDFSGCMFYYTYSSNEEILKFKVTRDFNIYYDFNLKNGNTSISWNNPFSTRLIFNDIPPKMSYKIFITNKNEYTKNFNLCMLDEKKANFTISNNNYTNTKEFKLDTSDDNYVFITGRIEESLYRIRPIFLYPNITIFQFIDGKLFRGKNQTSFLAIILWILVILILVILVLIFVLKYYKLKSLSTPTNYLDNTVSFTSLNDNLK